jgi:hypothetical protein
MEEHIVVNPPGIVNVNPTVNGLSGIQLAGKQLALIILAMMGMYIVFMLFLIGNLDNAPGIYRHLANSPSLAPDSIFGKKMQLVSQLSEEKRKYMEFLHQTNQMVLLNLLLPVLTSVLGYIFGTRAAK